MNNLTKIDYMLVYFIHADNITVYQYRYFLQMPHESTVDHSEQRCEHKDPPSMQYQWESFVVEDDDREPKSALAFDLDEEDEDSSGSDEQRRQSAAGEGN
jgi:hypothetical protein